MQVKVKSPPPKSSGCQVLHSTGPVVVLPATFWHTKVTRRPPPVCARKKTKIVIAIGNPSSLPLPLPLPLLNTQDLSLYYTQLPHLVGLCCTRLEQEPHGSPIKPFDLIFEVVGWWACRLIPAVGMQDLIQSDQENLRHQRLR
jgi:hypothetical protein